MKPSDGSRAHARDAPHANPRPQRERYPPIREYALIGDCHGAALVHRLGSIDWACLRRFDSGAVFARILDADKGGAFELCARELRATRREYLEGTMVLATHLTTETGEVRVLDCFAMRSGGRTAPLRQMLRCIEGVRGSVTLDVTITPRFDYGSLRPALKFHDAHGTYSAVGGDDALVLTAPSAMRIDAENVTLATTLQIAAGVRRRFALTWDQPHATTWRGTTDDEFDERLEATEGWWRAWSERVQHDGPHRAAVVRSAMVLKTLTTAPTGAIIAAPTTSLPEQTGGTRNWDYRYCWIRDSAFTVAALLSIGHAEVAQGFAKFLDRATGGHADDMQIMYGCYGERRLTEFELALEGYRASRPVRVGNGAATQRQIDVYGELLNVAHLAATHPAKSPRAHRHESRAAAHTEIDADRWRLLRSAVDTARAMWKEPDRGFWEIRGEPKHFVHSKVMCWVALDRGIRLAEQFSLAADLDAWRATRDEIRAAVDVRGVDRERGCFVQAFDAKALDASLLLLPIVGFVPPEDPRVVATVDAIQRELMMNGYVRRYLPDETDDGVGGDEGAFLMCSFWLVDLLALMGRRDEASQLFHRLLSVANDVGLYAEEIDVATGAFLGNFPQAFTHVSLINSALTLAAERGEPTEHPARKAL